MEFFEKRFFFFYYYTFVIFSYILIEFIYYLTFIILFLLYLTNHLIPNISTTPSLSTVLNLKLHRNHAHLLLNVSLKPSSFFDLTIYFSSTNKDMEAKHKTASTFVFECSKSVNIFSKSTINYFPTSENIK